MLSERVSYQYPNRQDSEMAVSSIVLFNLTFFISFNVISSSTISNSLNNILLNGNYNFLDLTHSFDNKTIYWTDSKNFEFTKKIEERNTDGSW